MSDTTKVTCKECGKTFHVSVEDQLGPSPTEYCSRICRMRGQN
jgi:endogenous inhibitor of DNA gyrase (YacG/DUF329 family)